jgi:two-component system, LytTR family, sensor kinase
MTGFCYPAPTSQKSPVRPALRLIYNNPSHQAGTWLIFVMMHRSRVKYVIEIIIHALFWLGVYYALKELTSSPSHSMVINHGNGGIQRVDVRVNFRYSGIVLGFLMLLFYSSTFWLFKKVIRFKNDFPRVLVITGWFALLFAMNFLLIRTLMGTSASFPHAQKTAFFLKRSDPAIAKTQLEIDLHDSPSDTAFFKSRPGVTNPEILPPFGGPPGDNWLRLQPIIALVFLAVLAIAAANFFIKEWIGNDLTRSQAQSQQLHTELRLLRSQVNPHFLFNTLNNLFSMAQKKGHEELADSIAKLSGMMRYMIYESNTDTAPLQREIVYLEDCIALNKLRYADNEVAVSFSHPDPAITAGISIAPMLFVPFLENAFKHGVSIGSHADITMDISIHGEKLIFACENTDFSGLKKLEEEKGGIGLENVRRRLQLLYPGKHELRAGAAQGKYTVNLQIELA